MAGGNVRDGSRTMITAQRMPLDSGVNPVGVNPLHHFLHLVHNQEIPFRYIYGSSFYREEAFDESDDIEGGKTCVIAYLEQFTHFKTYEG